MNNKLITRNIGRFLVLALLQILVFNNIYLGGYINPCVYVLFIAMLPTSMGYIAMMIVAFATGLCIDVSTNILGLHAFACTFVAFIRGIWLDKIIMRDNDEPIETPSIYGGSYQQFLVYLLLVFLIFHFVYYLLLIFSLRDLPKILIISLISAVISWLLAILYQTLFLRKNKRNELR
ncbi:MAG: rod shape-determining protein MreD [Bacteroidales bacterium]|nr:rod shape-determining protein MreD [Bacteroidales bacterium]